MSNEMALERIVIDAICKACNCPAAGLAGHTPLEVVGLDSLAMAAVISEVEAECGRQLSPDQLMTLLQVRTIGDIVQVIHEPNPVRAASCG